MVEWKPTGSPVRKIGRQKDGIQQRIFAVYFGAAVRVGRSQQPCMRASIFCTTVERIVGGIYDNRLLVKPVQAARSYLPRIRYETPYEGAKEMLLVEEVEESEFLVGLFRAMYEELPAPKKKKTR